MRLDRLLSLHCPSSTCQLSPWVALCLSNSAFFTWETEAFTTVTKGFPQSITQTLARAGP